MTQASTLCTYRPLADDLHEFVIHGSTREALDAYFDAAMAVINGLPPETPLNFLIEFDSLKLPSLNYMIMRSRQAYASNPGVDERMRIAFLHSGYDLQMAETILSLIRSSTTRRFFKKDERDAALAWLHG